MVDPGQSGLTPNESSVSVHLSTEPDCGPVSHYVTLSHPGNSLCP